MADKRKKRYYWIKLKEDFFEDDTILWLEEQSNGKEYCLIYLKLCLKSLKSDGLLVRNVGKTMIPYELKTLSKLTNTNPDTLKVALDLFRKIGLIELLDSGEIFMNQINELVGSETESAVQKRLERAKKRDATLSQNCLENVAQSIEYRDKSIEYRDKSIDNKPNKKSSTSELTDRFDSLWLMYPNKKGKENAAKAYKKAIKEGVTDDQIKTGIKNYLQEISVKNTPKTYIAHGSTWFSQRRWNDAYDFTPNDDKKIIRQEKLPDWVNNPVREEIPLTQEEQLEIERQIAEFIGSKND